MRIGGLQKTTMLDFPGRVSAILFTQGCHFCCPYCHNPELVGSGGDLIALDDVMRFLEQRKAVLEGVVITGGEPTLHGDLDAFCRALKQIGYAVKLDTNGSNPDMLEHLLQLHLLDYVAMDIKANPEHYPESICHMDVSKNVLRSLSILEHSAVEHEFRIPCVAPFVDTALFEVLPRYIQHTPIFLQAVRLDHVLQAEFFPEYGHTLDTEAISALCEVGCANGLTCCVR